ncbi:MAG TPA: 16S rRNA (adenine(1518)-N(6)/adenine(1519)-N(6))-dimethyltransferase RsmA [Williamwhitmania sp.]|nr:16S rRNA (adenine(1518)-N(6)/adenine(1519)-N(6))-dimethyltransferase RsmA [Williamwhitmania sp.]
MSVRPKKQLGQHFLRDNNIARKIVDSLQNKQVAAILEVGPGMGVLTQFLVKQPIPLFAVEVDRESVEYLNVVYPQLGDHLLSKDFLKLNLAEALPTPLAVVGNFPYNISSQIFFHVLDYKDRVPEVVGMVQKEVAERMAERPGSKTYGILSVLLQCYYNIEYLFTVNEQVFDPPPKVKSAVVRLTRNDVTKLGCDEKLFVRVVKSTFNQRRKTIRNSIRAAYAGVLPDNRFLQLRPERLSVADFVELTRIVEEAIANEAVKQ